MRILIKRTSGFSLMSIREEEIVRFIRKRGKDFLPENPTQNDFDLAHAKAMEFLPELAEIEVKRWDQPHSVSELVSWKIVPDEMEISENHEEWPSIYDQIQTSEGI